MRYLKYIADRLKRSWFFYIAIDWLIVIGLFFAITAVWQSDDVLTPYLQGLLLLVLVWAIGIMQHAIAVLGHDGAHGHALKDRKRNDIVTQILAFLPIGISLKGYKRFHFDHHNHVGTPLDPELPLKATGGWYEFKWRFVFKDLAGLSLPDVAGAVKATRSKLCSASVFTSSFVLFWLVGAIWIPTIWYLALGTGFVLALRLRGLTEHGGNLAIQERPRWYQRVFTPHSCWYHDFHHRYPNIPFYRFKQLNDHV